MKRNTNINNNTSIAILNRIRKSLLLTITTVSSSIAFLLGSLSVPRCDYITLPSTIVDSPTGSTILLETTLGFGLWRHQNVAVSLSLGNNGLYIENSCSGYDDDDDDDGSSSKIIAVSVSSYSDSDSDSEDESELLVSSSSPLEVNSAWKASRAFGCLAILIGGFSWMYYLWYHIYYYQYYKSSSDAAAGEAGDSNDATNYDDNEDEDEEEEEEEHKRRRWISEEITQARIIGGIFFVAAFYQGLTLFFLRSSICNTTNGNGDGSIELRQQIGSSAEIIFGTNCSMSSGAHMTIASTVLWVVSGTLLCLGRQQRMRVDDDIDDDTSSEVQQEQGNRLDNEASSNADREDQATQNNGSAVDTTDSVPIIIHPNENTVDNKNDAENQTTSSSASQLMKQTESVELEEQPPQITQAGDDNITCAVDSLAISAMTELESQTQNHSRVTTSSKLLSPQTKKKRQQSKLPQTRRRRYRS